MKYLSKTFQLILIMSFVVNLFNCVPVNSVEIKENFKPLNFDKICFSNNSDIDSFHKDKYTNLEVQAWVVLNNAPAFSCYKGGNEILDKLKMRFRYRVVSKNYRISKNGKEWCLLAKGAGDKVEKYIGWVDYNSLMFNPFPIVNPKTNIYEKILLKEGDLKGGRALRIYNDRDLKNPEIGCSIKVCTVYYVYDFYPKFTGTPSSYDTKSLLISPENNGLDISKQKSPLLIGWIDRKKVSFWETRLGLEIPVGKSLTIIDENNNQIQLEPKIKPLPYNALRNPILKEYENDYLIGVCTEFTPIYKGFTGSLEGYENSYGIFHQYIEGKISKKNEFIKYILITKTNIEKIITFLNNLIGTPDLKNKKDTWSGFLEIILGDDENCKDFHGNDISIEKCNEMKGGIPIKANFMKYTIKQFLELSAEESKKVLCEAKILIEKLRMINIDRQIRITIIDEDTCQYTTELVLDINNDGIIVRNGVVMNSKGKYIREARETDLEDKYFFKERYESVAWIPLKSLEIDYKTNSLKE